jgi:hypothetical protein
MKTARTILTTLGVALTTVPAYAGARADHSGLLVWSFLGLCAMIVAAQVVPAGLLLVGMIRGLVGKRAPLEAE